MKQLTDSERLEIAMGLLDDEQVDEYAQACAELEHQPERNGFHDVPAKCEDCDCATCTLSDISRRNLDCPYVD